MTYIIFILFALIRGVTNIIIKFAQKNFVKNISDSIYYTLVSSVFQIVFLIFLPPYSYNFRLDMFLYPACFGFFYFISYTLLLKSLKEGPTSLTNVIYNFQSIVPIVVGLFIWKDTIDPFQMAGLVLFVTVLFLFNKGSYSEGEEVKKITLKWVFFAILAAFFMGVSVIFTKQYMLTYDGYMKEYLVNFNIMVILMAVPYVAYSRIKKKVKFKPSFKYLAYSAAPALLMDITNIIYMTYVTRFASAFFFPVMAILSIISIVVMSRVILKEGVSKRAYWGIGLSFVAIYLLSL